MLCHVKRTDKDALLVRQEVGTASFASLHVSSQFCASASTDDPLRTVCSRDTYNAYEAEDSSNKEARSIFSLPRLLTLGGFSSEVGARPPNLMNIRGGGAFYHRTIANAKMERPIRAMLSANRKLTNGDAAKAIPRALGT